MAFKKIISEMLPLADKWDMSSSNKLLTPITALAIMNKSQGSAVVGVNFNDFTTNGTFEFPSGVYINQPPVTVDGTSLKAGFLEVIADKANPATAVFQEYKVWQAGVDTGQTFTRGWHGTIGSWGNWVEGSTVSHNNSLNAHSVLFGPKIRNPLTATSNIYVSEASGNDSTGDGSSDKPFKTWTGAINYINSTDQRGRLIRVYFGPGNYTGATIGSAVDISGDLIIQSTDNDNPPVFTSQLSFRTGRYASLNGTFKFQGNPTDWSCLHVSHGMTLTISNATLIFSGTCQHSMVTEYNGSLSSAASVTFQYDNFTASSNVIRANGGRFIFGSAIMSGNATGRRAVVQAQGMVHTNGAGPIYIPGTLDILVDTASGGIYV